MPDPIDELEGFTMPTVTPLPASEVRRRGDRIRRRNNALATAGALAVVAAVATPFAVLAGHQSSSTPPQPMPSSIDWRQAIPGSFDLAAVPDGSPVSFTVRDVTVVDDFTVCGRPAFSTGSNDPVGPAQDTAGAGYGEPGTADNAGRTLAVYADDREAQQAVDTLRQAVEDCPADTGRGTPYLWGVVDTSIPADGSLVVSQQVDGDPVADLSLTEVVRIGNAVFLGSMHTTAGGQQAIDETLPALTSLSQPVVDQMCVFSATPCPAPPTPASSSPSTGEGAVSAIPSDFPLDRGLTSP